MKQFITTTVIIIIIVGLIAVIVLGSRKNRESSTTDTSSSPTKEAEESKKVVEDSSIPVYYYGDTCPHCHDVLEWMEKQNIEATLQIEKKEVYQNKNNAQELTQVARACGINTSNIGVPFLYAEGKCLIGTPDIISYLSEKMAEENNNESEERSTE